MHPHLDKKTGLYRQLGKIQSVSLGFEDHGFFTFFLHVDYGMCSQSVGGWLLSDGLEGRDDPPPLSRPGAMDFIIRIVHACGVDSWEKVAGRTVYFLWPTENAWNTMPIGLQNLETEPGCRFLFKEAQDLAQKVIQGVEK